MNKILFALVTTISLATGCSEGTGNTNKYTGLDEALLRSTKDSLVSDTIVYHQVRVDHNGNILPWYSANLGESFNYVLDRVWLFWKNIEVDSNGMKYYMNHQV